MIPLALVGMSYREAPSAVRAALAAFDSDASGPSRQLLDAGEITGVVRIESCARVEWLLASERPSWAAELFSAALIGAAENPDHVRPRVRHGAAAVGGLLRVAAGLDSVAQGEHAIGRQVLRAFEQRARSGHGVPQPACRVARRRRSAEPRAPHSSPGPHGWRAGAGDPATGWQCRATTPVAVFGLGEIGQAMLRALADAGFTAVESFNRASMRAFEAWCRARATSSSAPARPQAWLHLPERADASSGCSISAARCSCVAAPGWQLTALDELLDGNGAVLPEAEFAALEMECAGGAEKICQTLLAPPPSDTLAAMTAMRTEFMQNKLPALLEGMPPQRVRKLTSEVNAVLHQFISAARRDAP